MDLVEAVYGVTRGWPKEEMYGLTSQIRRAAVSLPSNIADGQGRKSDKEFAHHISIAYGSLREVETQILIAGRLGYTAPEIIQQTLSSAAEVGRMLNGLYDFVASRNKKGSDQ